jgi:hypothetical protein
MTAFTPFYLSTERTCSEGGVLQSNYAVEVSFPGGHIYQSMFFFVSFCVLLRVYSI